MKIKSITIILTILFFSLSVLAQAEVRFLEKAKNAEIIAIAQVVETTNSASFWSGLFPSVQQVRYKVEKVLKGKVNSKEILVGHYIVKNSYTADKNVPRLSQTLFNTGNKLILIVESKGSPVCKMESNNPSLETFCSSSENFGVRLFNQELAGKLEKQLTTK